MNERVLRLTIAAKRLGVDAPARWLKRWCTPGGLAREWRAWRLYQTVRRSYGPTCSRQVSTGTRRGKRLLVASLGPSGVQVEAALIRGLEQAGFEPVVLAPRYPWIKAGFASAGIRDVHTWDAGEPGAAAARVPREALASFERLTAWEHHGIRIGRIAASTALRRLRRGSLPLDQPLIRETVGMHLRVAQAAADTARAAIEKIKPDVALFADRGYTPYGELFEACLHAGVPAITWNLAHKSHALIMKRYQLANQDEHPSSLSEESWQRVSAMPWNESHRMRLREELAGAYASGDWYSEVGTQAVARFSEPEAIRRALELDPRKKTAVIFPHILWDGTFFFGTDLFRSYEEWLFETVRAAKANPRVNWVIKIHPANAVKNARDGVRGEPAEVQVIRRALGSTWPAHLKVLPVTTPVSTHSLFSVTDYCVTVRGTVGMEAASAGIQVITAGTGRFDRRGFTIDPESRDAYHAQLGSLETLPPLSEETRALAERFAYGVFLLRPLPLTSMSISFRRDRQASLEHRLHITTPGGWQRAEDLRQFGEWVAHTTSADYLHDEPAASQTGLVRASV